ncbi:glucose repression mediator protein [Mucor circinelloides 1006PhL]|uniref:Glucose repression mediator protein n=1 Tax=Mucor circinelloides f. circinelloides (strain 1006PhL) TaxID=1220926 RepID=S2JX70_MUCC1|nr:glucose repression mediator protein [Mucor circinelloides 1006PhL]
MAATVPPQQVTAAQKLAQVNEQTWLTMGNLAEMMTDYDKAMSCYESALRHNPYSVVALSQIASLCRGREQFGRAVDYFKRILAIQENNGETWAALGHCYLMMDNLQEAYQAYQQALYHLSNPKDPKLWYGIGILYDRYGSLEHAEEAFSAVMKMDPKFEKANEIYFRLGIIYKQQQKYDLSLQCFRYILHNPPRPLTESDIWFQTGHVYEQQKEYELAKEAYERVLAENPDHAKVLQQLGWLYHQQNTSFCNQALAIQYLTRSLKSDSNDAQSWYLLGRCYMAEQNYNKAYEAYQQAVYRDARNPTFWCSIGVLYYQINQYRDALDAYSRAIRLNPYISEVWYDLGTLYESCNNQVQDALDAYQRAAELDPSNPHIKQRLELLRKSQNVQSSQPGSAPVPQDVSNPSQYQSGGHNGQPLSGASYSQSAPTGPPSSMSAYHTALGGGNAPPLRPNDERVPTPQLPVVNHNMNAHEGSNGPARDLPMPGAPPAGTGRRSPGPYGQYPPSSAPHPSSSNQREDVRIPDIGGGRAPTPSDRSQMNPIIHDERQQHAHHPQQSLPPQQQQHMPPQRMSPQQQHQAQHQQSPQTNLPPMSMRQPYKEETRSPNPAPMSSPHSRPSPRTSHPLAPPSQYDHRLSPRTGHSDRYYEQQQQRSPASRPMEVDSSNTSSPRAAHRSNDYHRMKHEEYSRPSGPQPMDYAKEDVKREEHHQQQQHHQPPPPQQQSLQQPPQQQQQQQQQRPVDEDYDESAADALLSMGNPQLGQKRALQHEQEENKKPRPSNDEEEEKRAHQQQAEEIKEESTSVAAATTPTHAPAAPPSTFMPSTIAPATAMEEEKEEGEHQEEGEQTSTASAATTTTSALVKEVASEEKPQEITTAAAAPAAPTKEEPEEGEVEEHEEGEVKDDDDEQTERQQPQTEVAPTAAVAATNAASVAASQSTTTTTTTTKEESTS